MILGIAIILIDVFIYVNSQLNHEVNYPIKTLTSYYFNDIKSKIIDTLPPTCGHLVKYHKVDSFLDNQSEFNQYSHIHIITVPPDPKLIKFWRSIEVPLDMRLDPELCSAPFRRKNPIFKKNGCQVIILS